MAALREGRSPLLPRVSTPRRMHAHSSAEVAYSVPGGRAGTSAELLRARGRDMWGGESECGAAVTNASVNALQHLRHIVSSVFHSLPYNVISMLATHHAQQVHS